MAAAASTSAARGASILSRPGGPAAGWRRCGRTPAGRRGSPPPTCGRSRARRSSATACHRPGLQRLHLASVPRPGVGPSRPITAEASSTGGGRSSCGRQGLWIPRLGPSAQFASEGTHRIRSCSPAASAVAPKAETTRPIPRTLDRPVAMVHAVLMERVVTFRPTRRRHELPALVGELGREGAPPLWRTTDLGRAPRLGRGDSPDRAGDSARREEARAPRALRADRHNAGLRRTPPPA